jgi:glutathione S-transferase
MKLYHVPLTRSIRVVWLLEEMGITDYELVTISRDDWHEFAKSEEYQAVNMLGKYPGMRDGDLTMVESVAIMEYAIAKYGANGLAPASDDPNYGEYLKWLHFGESGMGMYVVMLMAHTSLLPEEHRNRGIAKWAKGETAKCLEFLKQGLGDKNYLLPSGFSAADISVGYMLFLLKITKNFDDIPAEIKAYWERLIARAAWQKISKIGM